MKKYDKKRTSHLKYLEDNKIQKQEISQKLSLNGLLWIEKTFQEIDEVQFFEFDVQYPKKLCDLHNDLPFLPERIKIESIEKLVAKFHDK